MRCSSYKPLLDRYVEGTLSAKQLTDIANHLESCAECFAIFDELKVVDALLTTIRVPAPQPNFTFAVMAEVRSMPVPVAARINVAAILGGYVAVAWVVIAVWLRIAGVSAQTALANTSTAAAQFFSGFHAITSSAMGSFGHGAPFLTTFVVSVLGLDIAVAIGVAVIYTMVRPRLAAQLASFRVREGS